MTHERSPIKQLDIVEKGKGERELTHESDFSISPEHNLTVYSAEGDLLVRQINNRVSFGECDEYLKSFAEANSLAHFNVPPKSIDLVGRQLLSVDDIIPNPVPVIFVSSRGLLNGSEWTSNQPSEGIAVLSEWLARNEPYAAPIFVDPNLVSEEAFEGILQKYGRSESPSLVGFSVLPVNLRNDIPMIAKTKQNLPRSFMVAGGIGSEILDLLPTKSGKKGISEALPIDATLMGTPFVKLSEIVKRLYGSNIQDSSALFDLLHSVDHEPYGIAEIQEARVKARSLFIPYERPDLVHGRSYMEANEIKDGSESSNIVSVLIDNRCDQGCYFCSSPKQQIYIDIKSAMDHLQAKVQDAEIIAVNDNDLSNNPDQTVSLCQEMIARGILQPKHGKMRVNSYQPELIEALARANFVRLAIGVESFDQNVRRSLNKKDFTDDAIERNLDHMLGRGIQPEINLIFFSPHETNESLEKTVRDSLRWVKKGCSLYATMGLFAVPNAPAIKNMLRKDKLLESQLVETEEVFYPGMKDALLFPTHWKSSEELVGFRGELLAARKELIGRLEERFGGSMSIPIEAYTAVALLANRFGVEGFSTKDELLDAVFGYAGENFNKQYVSI